MDYRAVTTDWSPSQLSRFEFSPPRHFLLPAILLLVSEKPGYGYSLVKDLQEFRFGQVDRPSVYRALAQLEGDGLVESWSEAPKAGQARRVYGLTDHGARALRAWMGVVKEERDCLDRVLRRYQATGTTDAALAEVEGCWAAALGLSWSSVSSTCPSGRRRPMGETKSGSSGTGLANGSGTARSSDTAATSNTNASNGASHIEARPSGEPERGRVANPRTAQMARPVQQRSRFRVVPDRSVLLIEARSSVGPMRFGAIGLTGFVDAVVDDGKISTDFQPTGHLEIALRSLSSGNSLYDAELLRLIDARRFPRVSLELTESMPLSNADRFRLSAEVTFHGVTRPLHGTVDVSLPSKSKLVVTGEQAFDIRDFEIASPTVLMLRIYPDVRVNLHVEAELEE
ncbi:MAG: helix-turn-helix transcriptional regulator [Actinomycetota bacterium]|nr:helix-turn-helix transcriptional regulator [Actinomycetota bacterium]